MKRKVVSIIFLLAALTACSSDKSIQDDWPGIDELILSTPHEAGRSEANAFTLKSKLILPKIGKKTSLVLTTSCKRNSYPSVAKTYTKTINLNQTHQSKPVDFIDAAPEELLVYPEYFKACDFEVVAKNQHLSTAKKVLLNQKFIFDKSNLDINLEIYGAKQESNESALPIENIEKVQAYHKDFQLISNSKFICFSDSIESKTISNASVLDIYGKNLILPKRKTNIPLEHCVVAGKDQSGAAILSNRLKVINRPALGQPFQGMYHFNNSNLDSTNVQIPYSESARQKIKIFSLDVENYESEKPRYFRLAYGKILDKVSVVNKLNEFRKFNTSQYKFHTADIPTYFEWKRSDTVQDQKFFKIESDKFASFDFYIYPSFLCHSSINPDYKNSELGFIVAPDKNSPILQLEEVSVNEFMVDTIMTTNIFEGIGIRDDFVSPLVKDGSPGIAADSSFQFFFRNQNTFNGENIYLNYRHRTDEFNIKGEPDSLESLMEHYPFSTEVSKQPDICEAVED